MVNWSEKFVALKCCILIPTYNNALTLGKVIADVSFYSNDILVVNDGSTDHTSEIVKEYPNVKTISYLPNMGKGIALQKGLAYAADLGYHYAITIDSDGQHFALDIPHFIDKITAEPGSLIIGARNMEQASVPGKSSLGNKISTFWFKFETGISLPDTQSGYRLYPLMPLQGMKFFTNKYEFEIEIIVRAAWKDVKVIAVPVKVYYAPKETRVSHFRPFKDFTRVGLLNVVLVTIAILYIKPRNLVRSLKKKGVKKRIHHELINPNETYLRKSIAIGFGVFMGIVPVGGYQMLIAITLAYLFKLNKVLVILAANISLPPLIPVIIYLSYHFGGLVLNQPASDISLSSALDLNWIKHNMFQYVVGSFALAISSGFCFGLITFILLKIFRKQIA